MRDENVTWMADGFAVEFPVRALRVRVGPELTLLYSVLSVVGAFLSTDPFVATALLGPSAGLWWATQRRHVAKLTVTHERLCCEAPFGRRWTVAMRDVREIEVFDREIEILLWGGQRVRMPAPPPGRQLAWIVGQLRQLRDETAHFALEMAEQPGPRPRLPSWRRALLR